MTGCETGWEVSRPMNIVERTPQANEAGAAPVEPVSALTPETAPARGVKLRPLAALLPYVKRYRGRAAAALCALIVAALATLAVPLAVRRMIDFGFTHEGL